MSETSFEPYAALGLPRGASERQVREAYRRLAKRYHPDLHSTNESADRMRRINRAWEILSNPVLRARYDNEAAGHFSRVQAAHWSSVARSSATWSTPRGVPPRTADPIVQERGPAWPTVLAAVALGVLVVAAALVGIVPFPFFGIAVLVLARVAIGRLDDGRH